MEKLTSQLIRMDANWRLYVPAWLREEMQLSTDQKFEVLMGDGEIIFRPYTPQKGE